MTGSLWFTLFFRSALILLGAELLRYLGRRSAPVWRHRMAFTALCSLLSWPLLALTIPEIQLPLWTAWHAHAAVDVSQSVVGLVGRSSSLPASFLMAVIWALGVLLALVPLGLANVRVRRMAQRSTVTADPKLIDLCDAICADLGVVTRPELFLYSGPVMPLTFGLKRARILLPAESLQWTSTRLRSVLLHELAHVRRRDLRMQAFAHLVTALWWFQPLSWRQQWLLRRESERACDALVVASGLRASEYAAELLSIAHEFGKVQQLPSAAIPMAIRSDLEGRLKAILQPSTSYTFSGWRSISGVAALAALTVSASALNLVSRENSQSEGPTMKRTLLSGLLASAGLSAATISGLLFDPSGSSVPGAKASLYNPDTAAKQETTTTADGKFAFENLPAGAYILRIEKAGFASLFREFNVREDSKVERGLTLNLGSIEQQVRVEGIGKATASLSTSNVQQIRVGGEVEQSHLTTKVPPVYPAAAKAAGVQGKVLLETVISVDGVPQDIRVSESPSDDLTQSALDAVRQWRYSPTLLNGKPVEVITQVLINYTLSQ